MEYSGSSSPDPLNDSPTYYSPLKTRRSATSTRTIPLHGSSPSKQTFELDVGNQSSPQRLIVTVEADTNGVAQAYRRGLNSSSPSRRSLTTRERTTTTIVPLKGLTDDEGAATPRKARGRPRRSNGTPVQPKSGRKSTPGRSSSRARRSFGDLIDGDDKEDISYQIGSNVEVRRGGRPRSRSAKSKARKLLDAAQEEPIISSDAPSRGRGRPRKSMSPSKNALSSEGHDLYDREDGESVPADIVAGQSVDEILMEPSVMESDEDRDLGHGEASASLAHVDEHNDVRSEEQFANLQLYESGDENLDIEDEDMDMLEEGIGIAGDLGDDVELEEEEDDEGDQLGELREYDTIMESEEFSMISVDSVPSLRQHFSSPADQENAPTSSAPLKNKSIENAKAVEAYNDSFSEVPDVILAAATPARHPRQELLAVPVTVDNSFSSVPPQILEAATPGWKSHITRLKNAAPAMDDSFSSVAPDILEAATPGRVLGRDLSSKRNLVQSSASKQATPSSSLFVPKARNSVVQSRDTGVDLSEQSSKQDEKSQRVVSAALSTTSSRLLTPDETPSPSIASSQSSTKKKALASVNEEKDLDVQPTYDEPSLMQSYMPSSPPTISQPSQADNVSQSGRPSLQTPYVAHSSPKLPSAILDGRGEASESTMQQRPELEPAARAGHVLQQSVLLPSSPRARSDSLGSPFKSPISERRSSISYPCLPMQPQEKVARPESRSSHVHQSELAEDPFLQLSQDPTVSVRSVYVDQVHPSSARNKTKIVNSRFSSIRSADVSTMSGSTMSWQPEREITVAVDERIRNASSDVSDVLKRKWEQERAVVSTQIDNADPVDVVTVDSGSSNTSLSNDDDEGLQLLLDTITSASPLKRNEHTEELPDKPKRSKLPSPWRKNGKRLIYSDELKQSESLSQQSTTVFPTNQVIENRVEPVSHFRSQQKETPILSDDLQDMDLSGYQVPQKANFKPRPRQSGNLEFAALMSPIKPLPMLSRPQIQSQPEALPSGSPELADYVKHNTVKPFAPIPQKATFLPSPRKTSKPNLFAALDQPRLTTPMLDEEEQEESVTLSERAPLAHKNLQAMNRSSSHTTNKTPSPITTSSSLNEDQENTPSTQKSRTLQWTQNLHLATKIAQTPLPDKHASPTKSCFRTPSFGLQQHKMSNQSPSKNVVFVSSSPAMPSPSPEQQLSVTEWGKEHWKLLEAIMISHQPSSSPSSTSSHLPTSTETTNKKRRNSTRVISKLLGRRITSQGMEMRFQQWHLEAVDEFREKVGGWQEKDVAEKLFGLIVAAERRRLRALGEIE